VALRADIDNWRWAGVPFFLRTGKALKASRQVVTIGFREPTPLMFPVDFRSTSSAPHNEITIDFGEPGSISARFLAKEPGREMRVGEVEMTFRYADAFPTGNDLEGYEHLILDAYSGQSEPSMMSTKLARW
jgi:glucose-6-phosphate 1-dehydrogenase